MIMLSEKEQRRRNIISAVMRQAWAFHKRTILFTITFRASLKIAWQVTMSRNGIWVRHSKVIGVKRRQAILWRLNQYRAEDIAMYFRREFDNPYDYNAIQIMAAVKGKGTAILGYLRQELAATIAPMLDAGQEAVVMLDRITGAGSKGLRGCNFSYIII